MEQPLCFFCSPMTMSYFIRIVVVITLDSTQIKLEHRSNTTHDDDNKGSCTSV